MVENQIPSINTQDPEKFQIPSSKFRAAKLNVRDVNLEFGASLEVEVWDLELLWILGVDAFGIFPLFVIQRLSLHHLSPVMVNKMIAAIVANDVAAAKKLLRADAGLATCLTRKPKLHNSRIFHWIYVGDTLLHLAAAGYRLEIIRLLLASGADPNAAHNHRKSTPLHYAADGFITGPGWDAGRQVETLGCLIANGADIHLQDMNGATALHRAVRTRCAAAVKFLLEAGSDPSAKNKPGSTAFHLAVQNTGRGGSGAPVAIRAQREIIQTFLSFGLSPKLKSGNGKTVGDSARSEWIREMLR